MAMSMAMQWFDQTDLTLLTNSSASTANHPFSAYAMQCNWTNAFTAYLMHVLDCKSLWL